MSIEPAKRVIAGRLNTRSNAATAAASRALLAFADAIWGLRLRLYADVRSADSQNYYRLE
jgi:steroid 5-alpha reductase family enzyme